MIKNVLLILVAGIFIFGVTNTFAQSDDEPKDQRDPYVPPKAPTEEVKQQYVPPETESDIPIPTTQENESSGVVVEQKSEPEPEPKSSGGGCLIATAAFGSEMAPQVQFLRELRDNTVLQTQSGTSFMTGFNQFYYSFSPAVADLERENPAFKETVKLTLTPLLTSLTLLNYVDIDSEQEMLGYGIGIIMLNIGMYFVAPAIVISKLIGLKRK